MAVTKEQALQIPALKKEGKSNSQIAEAFGCSIGTIHYWIRRLKIKGYTVKIINKGGRPPIEL